MPEKNTNGGNLIIAVIIAIIVGVVVYFMIDNKPTNNTETPISTGADVQEGAIVPPVTTGG